MSSVTALAESPRTWLPTLTAEHSSQLPCWSTNVCLCAWRFSQLTPSPSTPIHFNPFDPEVTKALCFYSRVYSNSWSWAHFSKLLTTREGWTVKGPTLRNVLASWHAGWLIGTLFLASTLHHHDSTTEPSQLTLAMSQWCRVAPSPPVKENSTLLREVGAETAGYEAVFVLSISLILSV